MKRLSIYILLLLSLNGYTMAPKVNWDNAIEHAVKRYGLRVEPQLISFFKKALIPRCASSDTLL